MKNLKLHIKEALFNGVITRNNYNYFPEDTELLYQIIDELAYKDPNADLNCIDTSKITNMDKVFTGQLDFNGDISKWNTKNVTSMEGMFNACRKFNCDISKWDVSNVKNFDLMFLGATKFNQNLSRWNVNPEATTNMMFEACNIEEKNKPKY